RKFQHRCALPVRRAGTDHEHVDARSADLTPTRACCVVVGGAKWPRWDSASDRVTRKGSFARLRATTAPETRGYRLLRPLRAEVVRCPVADGFRVPAAD